MLRNFKCTFVVRTLLLLPLFCVNAFLQVQFVHHFSLIKATGQQMQPFANQGVRLAIDFYSDGNFSYGAYLGGDTNAAGERVESSS